MNLIYEGSYYTNLDQALYEFRAVSEIAKAHGLWHKHLEVLTNMAWCASHHNNIDSLSYFLNASKEVLKNKLPEIQEYDKEGESIVEIYNTSGIYYHRLNDHIKAIDEFKKIINFYTSLAEAKDSLIISTAFTYIGDAYFKLLNLSEAKIYHELGLQWLPHAHDTYRPGIGYHYYYSVNQSHLGKCNHAQAKRNADAMLYASALEHYRNAVGAINSKEQHALNPVASSYNRISQIYADLGKYDSALMYLNKTTQLLDPSAILMIETNILLGDIYFVQNKGSRALSHFDKSLELVNMYVKGKHARKAEISYRKGQVYFGQQNYLKALEHYQESLEILVDGFKPGSVYSYPDLGEPLSEKDLIHTFLLKGQAFFGLYQSSGRELKNLEAALEHYQQAAELIDIMRNKFQSAEYKQYIASSFNTIYENAINAAFAAYEHTLEPEYLAKAYYFAEKNKSRILLEAVSNSFATSFAAIPQEILEKERKIYSKLSFLNNELVKSKNKNDQEKVNSIRNQLLETNLESEKLHKDLEEKYPAFYRLKYDTKVAGIDEVRKGLAENAAVLEYFYGDSAVYIFGVSQSKLSLVKHNISELQLNEVLADFLSKVKYPPGMENGPAYFQSFVKQSSLLYKALLKQSLDNIRGSQPIEELLIIPDGPLGYLPFEVLVEGGDHISDDFSNLNFLIKNFSTRYEFSGTLSLYEKGKKEGKEKRYAYIGFAPSYEAENRNGPAGKLPVLMNNQSEIEQVSRLIGGISLTGEKASKSAFKNYASQSKILHLSMHALANDHNQLNSGLVFSAANNINREILPSKSHFQDEESAPGFLYLYELYNMDLDADLAILSACQTGIGPLARGEGIISLGRAFKYAGCPNIIMSLWNANDQATAGIIQGFSESLLEGLPKDEALRKAKLAYLSHADQNLSHPYYWSAFILVGDNESLALQSKLSSFSLFSKPVHIVLLLIVVALTVMIGIILKRRRSGS